MIQPGGTSIACPNCKQSFPVKIDRIIDVGRDPTAKARLLSGQINLAVCPHCGFRSALGAPLLYHDPAKELLLVHVPMELGLPQAEQERVIGDLVNRLMSSLPAEQRRGYLLRPRPVLTLQGLVEAVLQADGITPEMLEQQRAKMRLIEMFLQADEDDLPALIAQYDGQIDMEMFQIITSAAETALQNGRQDVAQRILAVRDRLIRESTAGKAAIRQSQQEEQAIQDVLTALEGLGENATRQDFMALVLRFAEDDAHLQALVGLERPLFDYTFFQQLSEQINRAGDGEKAGLESLRNRLLDLTALIDQQRQAMLDATADVLREIVNSPDVEEAVRRNLPLIDDNFMAILAANIRAAEQKQDLVASARLKQVSDVVMQVVRENAPPELRFISDLLAQESPQATQTMLQEQAAGFGPRLLDLMDALVRDLLARGDQPTAQRLVDLREQAAEIVGAGVS